MRRQLNPQLRGGPVSPPPLAPPSPENQALALLQTIRDELLALKALLE
ncbi:MAG: hypothetical protein LAN71_15625 [Acidobacteriia bacterium]|nr:hypothetical protein [Terriglobia bacterium]